MTENAAEAPEAAPPRRLSLDEALAAISDETTLKALEASLLEAYDAFNRSTFEGCEFHAVDAARRELGKAYGGSVAIVEALQSFRTRLADLRARATQ
jgi:hypothetical protein